MQQRTFASILDETQAHDERKWDTVASPTTLTMENGSVLLQGAAPGRPTNLTLNGWATTQLCHSLGIPASYFKRCPAPLQDQQVTFWLDHHFRGSSDKPPSDRSSHWLLRCQDATLRGVLSERYTPYDNSAVVSVAADVLGAEYSVSSVQLTEESFHLRLVRPKDRVLVDVGDELCAGIHIANSEVGMRSLTVDLLVYRLVCSNGLIVLTKGKSVYSQRHIGINPNSVRSAVLSAVKWILEESSSRLERFASTAKHPLEKPEEFLRSHAERWQLGEHFQKDVLGQLALEAPRYQHSLYGLVNAITAAAQNQPADERYRVEALAGSLVERHALVR